MIIDPKEYFKIDYKKVLKEKGIKGIPEIVCNYLIEKCYNSVEVIYLLIMLYSSKDKDKKDKEKGGDKDEEERNI